MASNNDYICGVNWSTMKKIAKFFFGEENIGTFKKTENRYYIIYIDKTLYNDKRELVNAFEDYWNVSVKPMELV